MQLPCYEPIGSSNILYVEKTTSLGVERYLFIYSDGREREVQQQFGIYAVRPDLSFTWHDALVASKRVMETAHGAR